MLLPTAFWAFVLGYQVFLVFIAPAVVNGAAYLAGAGPSVTFVPQSHQRDCSVKGGCHTVTLGALETGRGPVSTDWPAEVPLGRPFSVRAPVWFWAGGRDLVHGKGGALEAVGFGLLLAFSECVLAFLASLSLGRRWRLPRSRERGGGRHERAG